MNFSPLFWPVALKDDTIFVLDETLLPSKVEFIKSTDYKKSCEIIKEMKTRAVGQVILVFYTFLLEIRKNQGQDLMPLLEEIAQNINATRPTLSFKYLTDMVLGFAKSGQPLEKCILGFLEVLKAKRIKQAQVAANLVGDGDCILTHCNISGLMPLIAEYAKEQNKKLSFFVTETPPYLQGLRLTAWELQEAGFTPTVISDNMVAQVMHEGKINKVIVGADNLAQNGDIANKIGTYQIAILAKNFNIPFYVLCPPPSSLKTGKDIKIEIRPQEELFAQFDEKFVPKGVKGYYPGFDVTPNELITKHIYLEISR